MWETQGTILSQLRVALLPIVIMVARIVPVLLNRHTMVRFQIKLHWKHVRLRNGQIFHAWWEGRSVLPSHDPYLRWENRKEVVLLTRRHFDCES